MFCIMRGKLPKKMTKYQINSSLYSNILRISAEEFTNCMCTVNINKDHSIEIPLIVAITSFESVSQSLSSDITTRHFDLNINFEDKVDNQFYDKLVDLLYGREVTLSDEDILCLAKLSLHTNNEKFIIPLRDQINKIERNLSLSNCFDSITMKHRFKFDLVDFSEEIELLSVNFESQKNKLIDLSRDITYIGIISRIISNEHLKLQNEDSLISFVLSLCSIDTSYEILFSFVYLEYCSLHKVREFVQYVNDHISTTKHHQSLFKCMSRRLIEEHLPLKPSSQAHRHIDHKDKPTLKHSITVSDSDPTKGIFYQEYQKQRVAMEYSSIHSGKIYHLLQNSDSNNFESESEPDSWVKFSLGRNRPFIIQKYKIRGNYTDYSQLQSWDLEGKLQSTNEWIVLDSHKNQPFKKLERKVFPINCDELLIAVRLVQTGLNISGGHGLYINEFDIFGEYESMV